MLKQIWFRVVFVSGMAIILPSCVSVRTTIYGNAAIAKRVRVEVETSHEASIWKEMRDNLARPDQGWSLHKFREGQNTTIIATQSLPDANRALNTSLRAQRTGWTHRHYNYQENIPLARYAASTSTQAVAAAIPVVYSLRMPGRIVEAPGASISQNVATWNFNLGEREMVIQAASSQSRYCMSTWTVIAALLLLAMVVAWIKEKFLA